jgi:hypothetical protein
LEWREQSHGEKYAHRRKALGAAAQGEKVGCSLYEVPPGYKAWPFHYHCANGDIDQDFDIVSTGDNSNQYVGITGNANTSNAQTQFGVTDFGNANGFDRFDRNRFSDFGFNDSGATVDVSGNSSTSCDQEVNQAAAVG